METIMGNIEAMAWMAWIINIGIYVFTSFCLHTIARKTNTEHAWLAWIPIANLYLVCRIAGRPWWWLLLFFIPIVNIVVGVIVWMGIAEARDKNKWLGILMIVPIANLVMLGYLAFSGEGTQARGAGTQTNLTMPRYPAYAGGTVKAGNLGTQANLTAPAYPAYTGGATTAKETEPQANKGVPESQKAVTDIGLETCGKKVRLVIPLSAGFEKVTQFKEHLEKVGSLAIVMIGGSVEEGLIIIVSVQEEMDLISVLNEMPVVESAHEKGENIVVKLKTPSASKESGAT